jgi:hypothetical protein
MFRRFHRWLACFLGFEIAAPPPSAPEALLERYQELFRKKVAAYDRALASRAAFCEVLRQQIGKLETDRTRLNTALAAQAKALAPAPSAGELALRWEAQGNELADLRTQLCAAEHHCADLAAARDQAIQEARAQIAELKGALGHSRITQALSALGDRKHTPP